MRLSSTSRNDPDDFFTLFLIESMHDQQNRTGPYGSNRYPSLFIFRSEVALRESVGIIENEHGRFKTNVVLAKVLPVLLFIPFKSHRLVAPKTEYSLYLRLSIQLYVQPLAAGSIAPPQSRVFILFTPRHFDCETPSPSIRQDSVSPLADICVSSISLACSR
jgi:hypothetical protein